MIGEGIEQAKQFISNFLDGEETCKTFILLIVVCKDITYFK